MKQKFVSIITGLLVLGFIRIGCLHAEQSVMDKSRRGCVRVLVESNKPTGSGFFIGKKYVATCFDVITHDLKIYREPGNRSIIRSIAWKPYKNIKVMMPDGEKINAKCISVPTKKDLSPVSFNFAVLKLEKEPGSSILVSPFYEETNFPPIGEDVYFSGYPIGPWIMVTEKGMISGWDPKQNLILIQATVNKGNSGGALLTGSGKILGIVSMRESGISRGLDELRKQIRVSEQYGNVIRIGADPLKSCREIVDALDEYVSTGIGYSITIRHLKQYLSETDILNK